MCRIYGHFNAEVSRPELQQVAALQRHGGPDSQGSARGARWSIGGNRLAVMDPSGGRQPYRLLDGRIQVVFNGEIYNHDRLREQLRGDGYTFPDRCDGSILPALYHRYGDAFVEHLDGMYAVAVIDLRAEPRLLLATDPSGMKPLYYRWDAAAGALYFSSELPALLAFDAVPQSVWEPGLDAYLATKTPFGEQTMFAGIKVLPPGATAVCGERSGLRVSRAEPATPSPVSEGSREAVVAELRQTLRTEVHRLLVADAPVASITSGGLDSSLVTAFAAEATDRLHTFNIAYHGSWPGDERHYAQQVARSTASTYHQVLIDPATFPDLIEDVVRHLGQPNADPIALSTFSLFAAVRDAGFKVALTGDAADEVFGGYSRMRRAVGSAGAGLPWYSTYLDELGVLPAAARGALYTSDYAAHIRDTPAIPAEATDRLRDGTGTPLQRITEFELGYRMPAYHLRRVDHLSMASSVEVRLPFCQPSVVRIGRSLPDGLRIDGDDVKTTLRAASAGLLPDEVLNRPKQPFTLPITAMLAPGWPLWDYARDLLTDDRLRTDGLLDPDAVRGLFAGQAGRPDDTTALTIWALMIHQVWREQVRGSLSGAADGRAWAA